METIACICRFCLLTARAWRVQRAHERSGPARLCLGPARCPAKIGRARVASSATPFTRSTAPGQAAGFSLAELLVASFVASVVLTSLVGFATAERRFFHRAEEQLTANQTLRLVLDVLSRDLRQAGFDARGTAVEPVVAATSTTLVLQQDDDGDGIVDTGSTEIITYAFRPEAGTLSRVVGRQSMPLVTGLPADGFQLSYMDSAGAALDPDTGGLDATDRAAIRRVRVDLLARATSGEPLAGVVTDVALRNRPWTP